MIIPPYTQEVRFSDIDSAGHVNNATYLTYFEQARIHFFNTIIGRTWDWNETGIIVARNEIDYLRPVLFGNEIRIHVGCSHVGQTSFTLTYTLVKLTKEGDEVMARGSSVLVCFNHLEQRKKPIPENWRSVLNELLSAAQ